MTDEPMRRLFDYDRRRYWLENGWSIRFRIRAARKTEGRPEGIRYSFTLHDVDGERILGFDNAHGVSRAQRYDHRHRFRRVDELIPYEFKGADELLVDFFDAVEGACRTEGVAFEFTHEDEWEDHDEPDEPEDAP